MKKLLLFLVFLGAVVFVVYKQNVRNTGITPSPTSQALGAKESQLSDTLTVEYREYKYAFSFLVVNNIDRLRIYPNYLEMLSAKELKQENGCVSLISGGFYTKENTPSGLFISEGVLEYNFKQNSLFNGILSVNDFATPRITRSLPKDHLRIALQTGPILKENGKEAVLSVRNDNSERRIMAATTGENQLIFIVVYDPSSFFKGPKLNDLPKILNLIEEEVSMIFADVINLDGGTASAFFYKDIALSELTHIGSFFCIR